MVHSGSYAMQHAATDNKGYTIAQTVNNIVAGGAYDVSGWVNIPQTTDAFTFKLEVKWQNASGSTLRTDVVKSFTGPTNGWTNTATRLLSPSSTAQVQVRMVVSSLNATIYTDDLLLAAATAPTPTSTATATPTASVTTTPTTATTTAPTPTRTATPPPTATPTTSAGVTTFTFNPVVDAYVTQASPTTHSATASQLQAVGGTTSAKQAFLRFSVTGLPAGSQISSAKLRLLVTNDSTNGGVFNFITDNSWLETVTWDTKPLINGPQLTSLGSVGLNQVVEVDLASVIAANGTYSFAITMPSTNTNTLGYASREHTTIASRPQLIITTQ